MENFVLYNPTSLHFGRGVCDKLGTTCGIGRHALLVYGKGISESLPGPMMPSCPSSDSKISLCRICRYPFQSRSGRCDAAAQLGRQHNVDVIVAVGGGSVIDSAKMIAIAIL